MTEFSIFISSHCLGQRSFYSAPHEAINSLVACCRLTLLWSPEQHIMADFGKALLDAAGAFPLDKYRFLRRLRETSTEQYYQLLCYYTQQVGI